MSAPQAYRKRPVEIEAMRLDPDFTEPAEGLSPHDEAHASIAGWLLGHGFRDFRVVGTHRPFGMEIHTLEGVMRADPGDWIIRGVQGEFYPCKPDIFEQTYERPVLARAGAPEPPAPDAVRAKAALDDAIQQYSRAEWDGDLVVDWILVAGLSGHDGTPSVGIEESRDPMPGYISTGLLHEALKIGGEYERVEPDGD